MSPWILLLSAVACCLAQDEKPLEFFVIGDWGETLLPGQDRVAEMMMAWAEDPDHDMAFIASTGDNFYPNGVRSVDDIQWTNKWHNVYRMPDSPIRDLVWYPTLGNHDYGWEEWAQINYTSTDDSDGAWYFPHIWYKLSFPAGDSTLDMFMFDSEALRGGINDHDEMMEWLEDELRDSDADWKLVFGHRQVYSAGDYGPTSSTMYNQLRPLLEEYDADMYVCGHDHSMQVIWDRDPDGPGVDYVISAGGGALTYPHSPEAERELNETYGMLAFHERTWGYSTFAVDSEKMVVNLIDDENTVLYTHTRWA